MVNKIYNGNKDDLPLQIKQFVQSVSAYLPYLITIQHDYSPITRTVKYIISVEDMTKTLANVKIHQAVDPNNYSYWILRDVCVLRNDFVILQLYWWLFSSTKHCG